MRNVIWLFSFLLSAVCLADGAGMAPINPAFLKWKARKERREAERAAQTNRVLNARLMTPANAQAGEDEDIGYGYMPSLVDRSYLANVNTGAKKAISQEGYATVYDLRNLNRLTPVRNQGSYGTCWAHATMASLESWLRTSENQTFDFSENNLANLHGGDWGFDDGGNADRASAYLLRWAGPVLESQDPYPNWGGSTTLSPARHVQRIRWITPRASGSGASLDNDDVKDAIMKYGALYVNYYHSSSYYNSSYRSYYHPSAERSNHAVALVGWDDNFSKNKFNNTPPGNGAFIVRNSWGSSWGDGGYFYVSYYDSVFARKELTAFCSAEETSKYTKVYQYDPLGEVVDYRASNSTTAYGAAIFTASGSDSIGAVGFYALVPNTAYTITVRKGVSAGSPGSGTLGVTQSGTVDDAGFVTIPLTSAVAVSSGTKFSVILKLTTPGYSYPLAVEYLYSGYTSAATASSGETFLSSDGSFWKDFTQVNSSASFCVKAYVTAGTVSKTLTGIACYSSDNSTKVAAGKMKTFTCKATYSDGSEKTVTPSWSITSGSSYGSISSSGVFTAANVSSEQNVGVRASYTEGGVTKTASFTVTITVAAPSAPTGLTATSGTESSCVRLSWTAASGATGYAVYRAKGSGKASSAASYLGEASKATYADTDATPGVDYTYFVKAKNGSGSSAFSTGANGWRALVAPGSVSASDGTSTTQVKITWGAVTGAGAYRVFRAESYDENAATALGAWQTALEYADTTATPGRLYYYFVKAAVDTAGTRASGWSVGDSGLIQKPVVPESLTIVGPASVTSGATASYTAQAVYSNGSTASVTPTWTLNSSSSTTATYSYTAPVVSAGQTVTLSASCSVSGKNLSATKTIAVTPTVPGTPSAPSVTAQTTAGVSLSWSAVSGAASYVVYRGTTTTAASATKIGTASGTTYTDASVSPGATVYYFIAAVNTAGAGSRSAASAAAVRPLAAPTGVTASNGAYTDKVRVSWSAVSGATHYRVSRATSLNGTQTDLGSWQTGTTYSDTSATAGTTYCYFVRAATSSGGANAGAKSAGVAGMRKVAVTLSSLAVSGPARVDAGATAVYAAKAAYSDATSKTVGPSWSIASGSGATITSSGTLTAASVATDAAVTLQASYTEGGTTKTATYAVTIVAPVPKTVSVSNVKAASRWPWQPLVDVDFTLAVSPAGTTADVSVEATDNDRLTTFLAQTLTGDTENLAAGTHRVTWNLGADKPEYSTTALDVNVKARVHEDPPPVSTGTYLVIDLSGGTSAASYPVTYLDAVPSGGWTDEYKTTKLVLRRIEAGTFTMGDQVHGGTTYPNITLTKPYYIGVFEVTQRQWELVMGTKPSYFSNVSYYAARPVEKVSYNMIRGSSAGAGWPSSSAVDASSFLGVLRSKTGNAGFDLPTEAQWEYAARSGTTTDYGNGTNYSNSSQDSNMDAVGRYGYNSGYYPNYSYSSSSTTAEGTAKVGSYAPNGWGLYDMHGNVWEWCLDWYGSLSSGATDPKGAASGSSRVMRGGGWSSNAYICRSACRGNGIPSDEGSYRGFRLCCSAGPSIPETMAVVTFNANGGDTPPEPRTVVRGQAVGELPLATRTGYTFDGWFTSSSDGTQVTSSTVVTDDVIYYAHWTATTQGGLYCVIDLSGGTSATSYPVTYLDAVPTGGWPDEYKTTKLVLRRIETGTFTMGSEDTEVGYYGYEAVPHQVSVAKPFYMGVFPVTQRQWELVMGRKPSYFSNASYYASRPVEQVSYNMIRGSSAGAGWPGSSAVDASSFLGVLRAKTQNTGFDLPTEAQWEYACRAGTTTALNSGKNLTSTSSDANMAEVGRYWYNGGQNYSSSCGTSAGTAKVGSYLPNNWGLYDMHGNVWEWCLDWYQSRSGFSSAAVSGDRGSDGPASVSYRVMRGGSWNYGACNCRSAYRNNYYPSDEYFSFGFRLCCSAGPSN